MKKLTRHAQRFQGLTLGLDVHKSFIQYCLLDAEGEEVINDRVESTPAAMEALLAEHASADQPLQATLEASGCFLWVYDLLLAKLGHDHVHVAAPSRIRVIADSQEKNDANDAWWLAYLSYEGRLPTAFVAEGDLRELRIASRELRSITDERSDLKRRMKSHLAQLGMTFHASNWSSRVGRQRISAMVASVESTDGVRGMAIAKLWQRILTMDEEVDYWAQQLKSLSYKFKEIAMLEKHLPGVGPMIAASVWSELGDPSRYHSAKAYAKATGLTPGYRFSGGHRSGGRMTRQGSALVRWSLTRAIVVCLRNRSGCGHVIAQWVDRMSQRKAKKSAIVCAARKLAECIWRLFVWGEALDLSRAFPTGRRWKAGV